CASVSLGRRRIRVPVTLRSLPPSGARGSGGSAALGCYTVERRGRVPYPRRERDSSGAVGGGGLQRAFPPSRNVAASATRDGGARPAGRGAVRHIALHCRMAKVLRRVARSARPGVHWGLPGAGRAT